MSEQVVHLRQLRCGNTAAAIEDNDKVDAGASKLLREHHRPADGRAAASFERLLKMTNATLFENVLPLVRDQSIPQGRIDTFPLRSVAVINGRFVRPTDKAAPVGASK